MKVVAARATNVLPSAAEKLQFWKSSKLPLETVIGPVICKRRELLLATRDELAKIMEELLVRDRLTTITILRVVAVVGSSGGSVGADEFDDCICKPVTRIDDPRGKDPRNTRQPWLPISDWITIDTVGPPTTEDPLLSMASVAPDWTVMFEIVTVICPAAGLALVIPLMLMLSVILPCTTTF